MCLKIIPVRGMGYQLIPEGNKDEIILKSEVEKAIEEGKFHIYTMNNLNDAIEVLLLDKEDNIDNFYENLQIELEKYKEKSKESEYIPSLIVRLRGKHSTKYLCSYHFVIENENTESELDKTNFDDYQLLLKKPSLKVRAGEVINFEFSEEPIKVRAYIWGDEIKELEMKRGTIRVPELDKKIVVGVEGTYKNGKILYAVVLDIRG